MLPKKKQTKNQILATNGYTPLRTYAITLKFDYSNGITLEQNLEH